MFLNLNIAGGIKSLLSAGHIAVILCCMVVIIFFSMLVSRHEFSKQRLFVAICTGLLIAIEVVRIVFRCKYLKSVDEKATFLTATNLDGFVMSMWVSIVLLLIAVIKKKDVKTKTFGLDFVFSISALLAIATIIYPVGVVESLPIYDINNLAFYISRSIIVMVALMMAFTGWISVQNALDLWRGVVCIIVFGVLCFVVSKMGFAGTNLFYVESCPFFVSLGINLPAPFHYLMIGLFFFVGQMILYLPFRIYCLIRYGSEA